MTDPQNALPLDEGSRAALAAEGLRYAQLDPADTAAFDRWLQAVYRGFHFDAFTDEQLAQYRDGVGPSRVIGVWDSTTAEAESPIATVASWRSPLRLGESRAGESLEVEGWAISLVSVAATHRRRGVARALLEGELRAAHAAGIPLAMLTASEATIYGRWGFGPAAYTADYRIDTRGLRFTAPLPDGRVHRVTARDLRPLAVELTERAQRRIAGEVPLERQQYDRLFALAARTASHAAKLRAARYDDAAGVPQGYVLYSVTENPNDFSDHSLRVEYLSAATDDAYAALWHYVLDQDLVSTVKASMRPVDEPLPWLVSNPRAVQTTARHDHLWLRILDVPAAVTARRYAAADSVVLRVADDLGFAAGTWLLSTDSEGRATVTAGGSSPDAAVIDLGVEALGALLLGGTPIDALRLGGRLTEGSPGAADRLAALVRPTRAPYLSTWF
ncbi:MAG: GNAT family N-acetyltransferase [Microcella sp.]|uniref:GNAT family N-acetyltransferase n=1 Tax=Microcella sp. TaxID=1913979 RepID=UPI0024C6926F|nr:GNAT family N-acetyltransferase [Microcella sp.]UYN84625.1 MAG: GNAT family N-acetyltransferase [Microcella sp.]